MTKINKPLVSICCITYNHEKYISDALEGFLLQKTDFPLEIIIQDDASTDRTADIIREYERKYPDIIKPIYHTENQFSKGVNPILLPFELAKGEFIAICEGDDYWIDPLKLQKQITEMVKYPDCYLCIHPAIIKWENGIERERLLYFISRKNKIVTLKELLTFTKYDIIPTASMVINRLALPRILMVLNQFENPPAPDFIIKIMASENGGMLYISDIMSVYRKNVPGNFSDRQRDSVYRRTVVMSFLDIYDTLNKFTNEKYAKDFAVIRQRMLSKILISLEMDIEFQEKIYSNYRDEISIKDKILWKILFRNSLMVMIMKTMKSRIFFI